MAEATTHSWSKGFLAALLERPFARRLVRDGRYTIPICIILICGCFAAAALLQMRLDRSHALAQAATFEQERTLALANATGQARNANTVRQRCRQYERDGWIILP